MNFHNETEVRELFSSLISNFIIILKEFLLKTAVLLAKPAHQRLRSYSIF